MRPLAEFIMRGRSQALIMAVLSCGTSYFYWFGAAVIGLVTLRKGIAEGAQILLWCLIPTVALLIWRSDFMPLATILASTATCISLRMTTSWRISLLVLMACGFIMVFAVLIFANDMLANIVELYQQALSGLQKDAAEGNSNAKELFAVLSEIPVTEYFFAGIFGLILTSSSFIACVLARWWQSILYNPGGFQQEFHRIQMSPSQAIALAVLAIICIAGGKGMFIWSAIACIPLMVSGLALVHGIMGIRGIKTHWIVLFYVLLTLIHELKLFLVLLAFVDSFVGFRQRLARTNNNTD